MKPRLLDAYCCQGGASKGYADAGFEVIGVDLSPQPRYPFEFHQGDAVEFIKDHGHEFDVIVGSPPCQRYSLTQRIMRNEHPDLIGPTRVAMQASGKPYVIENVEEARLALVGPIRLCGQSFGLHTYRHRLFESNVSLTEPDHMPHGVPNTKMGRAWKPGTFYHAVGNFTSVTAIRDDMGVPWMTRDGIRECIPPAYGEFIGRQLMSHLESQ